MAKFNTSENWVGILAVALFVAVIVIFNMHSNNNYLQCQLDEYQSNYDALSTDVSDANDSVNNAQGLTDPSYGDLVDAVDGLKLVDIPSTDTLCADPSADTGT